MGNLCSGGSVDGKPNPRIIVTPPTSQPASSLPAPGPLLRPVSNDKRRLNAEAAEKRMAQSRGRGVANSKKVDESEQAAIKAQYVGRITTHYQMRNEDVPLGLNLLSLEKLREHYQNLVTANRKEGLINRSNK